MFKAPVGIETWRSAQKRPGGLSPHVTITRIGEAPLNAVGLRGPGTGYWPGPDPKEGADAHAARMMRLYLPRQGRYPVASATVAPDHAPATAALFERRTAL